MMSNETSNLRFPDQSARSGCGNRRILDDSSAVSRCLLTKSFLDVLWWSLMTHTLKVSCRSWTYPVMYRDTIFTTVVCAEMDHDTVSLAVSSRFFCVLCFCGCMRASFVSFGHSNTRVSPDVSSHGSLSKVSNEETTQLEGIPCHEWCSVLLGSTQLSLLVSTRLGTWFFPVLPTRLEPWNSRVVYLELSRGVQVNEFADLTSSEFVSDYTEDKPNIVWSGRKHFETYEYVDEPHEQVKPDSCFQSND